MHRARTTRWDAIVIVAAVLCGAAVVRWNRRPARELATRVLDPDAPREQPPAEVTVRGQLVPGSLCTRGGDAYEFALTARGGKLVVRARGPMPDGLLLGGAAWALGAREAEGAFVARQVGGRCSLFARDELSRARPIPACRVAR